MRRQSEHFDDYQDALARLEAAGSPLPELREPGRDRARWSREREARPRRTWPRDPDGAPLYPRHGARHVGGGARSNGCEAGEPYALRLDMAAALARTGPLIWTETGAGPSGETGTVAAPPQAWGDVVLARKETPTSYHLSVVVDDALQGVTHVVRGQDLFWATSVHRLLQALLGLPSPLYHHHRLILDLTGVSCRNRRAPPRCGTLRAGPRCAAAIRQMVGLR